MQSSPTECLACCKTVIIIIANLWKLHPHTHRHTDTHTHTHTHRDTHTHILSLSLLYIHTHVRAPTHTHTLLHAHTYSYTHARIHTHTHTKSSSSFILGTTKKKKKTHSQRASNPLINIRHPILAKKKIFQKIIALSCPSPFSSQRFLFSKIKSQLHVKSIPSIV